MSSNSSQTDKDDKVFIEGLPIKDEYVQEILCDIFKDYQRVVIKDKFGGGFASDHVLLVQPVRKLCPPEYESPYVVKIAHKDIIEKEEEAHRRLRKILPILPLDHSPVFTKDDQYGGLKYDVVGGSAFEYISFHDYIFEHSPKDAQFVLKKQILKQMDAMWSYVITVPAFPIGASYDRVLPVNFTVLLQKPFPNITSKMIAPDDILYKKLEINDNVYLKGFVVDEREENEDGTYNVTLSCPARDDKLPASRRVRLCQVKAKYMEQFETDGVIQKHISCQITETRISFLKKCLQEACDTPLDFNLKTLTLVSNYNSIELPNPLIELPIILRRYLDVRLAHIHGDLNLRNILVEKSTRSINLIDFADARQDHVLHDMLRLETSIVTKVLSSALKNMNLTPENIYIVYVGLHQEIVLEKPFQIEAFLSSMFKKYAGDELANFPKFSHEKHFDAFSKSFEKAFNLLKVIRIWARHHLHNFDDYAEYYTCLSIYLLGSIKFKELDRFTKLVAFWGAATSQKLMNDPQASVLKKLYAYDPGQFHPSDDVDNTIPSVKYSESLGVFEKYHTEKTILEEDNDTTE